MNNNLEERYKNDISQGKGTRTGKRIVFTEENYKKRVRAIVLPTIVAVGLGTIGVQHFVDTVKDGTRMMGKINDYHREYTNPAINKAGGNDNEMYYKIMAEVTKTPDDVLFLVSTHDEDQVDQILKYTEYGSFNNFLDKYEYKDRKDFVKKQQEIVDEKLDMEETAKDLVEKQEEHNINPNEESMHL